MSRERSRLIDQIFVIDSESADETRGIAGRTPRSSTAYDHTKIIPWIINGAWIT